MTESSSSPRRNPTRRPPGRGGPGRGSSSPLVELAAIETPPELILFNAYLSAEKDVERERQRVRQAEVAKDKAAARLKEVQAGGSREAIAEAETEYRQRVEEWKRVRDGEDVAASGDDATEDATEEATGDVAEAGTAEDTAADAAAGAETSSDTDTDDGDGDGDDEPAATTEAPAPEEPAGDGSEPADADDVPAEVATGEVGETAEVGEVTDAGEVPAQDPPAT